LFVVPTIGFNLLYVLVIVRLVRRKLVWINVTPHPTAEWIAQQWLWTKTRSSVLPRKFPTERWDQMSPSIPEVVVLKGSARHCVRLFAILLRPLDLGGIFMTERGELRCLWMHGDSDILLADSQIWAIAARPTGD
jgi:hypothetical protein